MKPSYLVKSLVAAGCIYSFLLGAYRVHFLIRIASYIFNRLSLHGLPAALYSMTLVTL